MRDLRQKTIRSGLAKALGQGVGALMRLVFMVVLARLLDPGEFGLVAMATAITGLLGMFASAGLSSATVQARSITRRQVSTLFWVNLLIGVVFAIFCCLLAPVLVHFYGEPKLFWLTILLAPGFIFSAAGVQHLAILQREMRYATLTIVESAAQLLGLIAGVTLALAGFRYWALVGAAIVTQLVTASGLWAATGWLPGRPGRLANILPLLRVGGTITLNTLVTYVGYNLEKILLGRFWGADALGNYSRAYQLISVPIDNLNSAFGGVAFSALARLQDDPVRLRHYFVHGYSLVVSITVPLTLFLGFFSDQIFLLLFGPKWLEAAAIFRLMTPTVLIFSLINPFGWLLFATCRQGRSLRTALVIAPIVITACIIGLPYGPRGVAAAYSIAMALWFVPHLVWCVRGTPVGVRDLLPSIARPILASLVAGTLGILVDRYTMADKSPLLELLVSGSFMLAVYGVMILFVLGQGGFYRALFRDLRKITVPL
ncbi:lipopolysaccharide biosynthesis protein [Kaistia nematophila]|uniref:Lipopolysaccharide biosynthesis protein n=1 Tax=Kaistia nematophila TaxID=2994654 RepID=A0A9X3DZX0_9HYPH|nr:lipopolysaccharide biosynthesis protein [Kaistia nematophila]MCX5568531.1 lipopolysaccharide biosynthesis protein [Kaistia nematophila]